MASHSISKWPSLYKKAFGALCSISIVFKSSTVLIFLDLLSLGHTRQPVQANRSNRIEGGKSEEDPKVSPAVIKVHFPAREEGVGGRDGAVQALVGCGGGVEVATCRFDIRGHVRFAGRFIWRGEAEELVGGAVDGGVGQGVAEEGLDDVGEGVDAVHENPEARELLWRG